VNWGCTTTGLREQHERLGRAGGEQHLRRIPAMPCGDRRGGLALVRVRRQRAQRLRDRIRQPAGHRLVPHVDREIDQARTHLGVAVMIEVETHEVSMPDRTARQTSAVPSEREPICHTFKE
jgi:hypothetical protein